MPDQMRASTTTGSNRYLTAAGCAFSTPISSPSCRQPIAAIALLARSAPFAFIAYPAANCRRFGRRWLRAGQCRFDGRIEVVLLDFGRLAVVVHAAHVSYLALLVQHQKLWRTG